MNYQDLRWLAQTGDVLLVRGSMWVRLLTAESYSHVGLLIWDGDDGLWLYEFVEGEGYRSLPASQWFKERAGRGQEIYYGEAPEIVRAQPWWVIQAARAYRDRGLRRRYGWLSLLTVWWSQIRGKRLPVWFRVCSTFVQECWEAARFQGFERTADPGDIAAACGSLHRVAHEEVTP